MMSPETRGEMLWYALPWLLGFAGSVWLIIGAVLWLVWIGHETKEWFQSDIDMIRQYQFGPIASLRAHGGIPT